MGKTRLIGFAGRKRSGKTTLAKYLRDEHQAIILTVADYLKYLCCDLMNMSYDELNEKKDNGYEFDVVPDKRWYHIIEKASHIGIENIEKELKDKHITNIRQLLQVVGTDVIRKYDENWHVKKLVEDIESYSEDKLIVVDDVRFPNERKTIEQHGGEVFFIIRPMASNISNHVSEISLRWQDFDDRHIIINSKNNENEFIINFALHYNNDFEQNIPDSIFLYETPYFKKCGQFGYKTDYDDPLLKDLLRQVVSDKLFNDYGIIRYHTCFRELAERYIKEIDGKHHKLDKHCNSFLTINPLITENLKIYL